MSCVGGRKLDTIEGREADVRYAQPHEKHRRKLPLSNKNNYNDEHIISVPEPGFKASIPHPKQQTLHPDTVDSGRSFALKATHERESIIHFTTSRGLWEKLSSVL